MQITTETIHARVDEMVEAHAELIAAAMRVSHMHLQDLMQQISQADWKVTGEEFFDIFAECHECGLSLDLNSMQTAYWLRRQNVPPESHRTPIAKRLLCGLVEARWLASMKTFKEFDRTGGPEDVASEDSSREKLLSMRLDEPSVPTIELSRMSLNKFREAGIETVGQLASLEGKNASRLRGLSENSVNLAKLLLKELGLSFGCLTDEEKERHKPVDL